MGSVTNLQKNRTIYIPCNCKSEILVIDYDHKIGMADLAIYENQMTYRNKLSLWQRIVYCYNVLINKKPYADQISLSKDQLMEMRKFLDSLD